MILCVGFMMNRKILPRSVYFYKMLSLLYNIEKHHYACYSLIYDTECSRACTKLPVPTCRGISVSCLPIQTIFSAIDKIGSKNKEYIAFFKIKQFSFNLCHNLDLCHNLKQIIYHIWPSCQSFFFFWKHSSIQTINTQYVCISLLK